MKKVNKLRIREKILLLIAVGSLGAAGMQAARAANPQGLSVVAPSSIAQGGYMGPDSVIQMGEDTFFNGTHDDFMISAPGGRAFATSMGRSGFAMPVDNLLLDEVGSGLGMRGASMMAAPGGRVFSTMAQVNFDAMDEVVFGDDDFFEDIVFEGEDDYFETAATAIGIDIESLFSELDSGKSLAEIATANGVDPQVVIDALVADEVAFIDGLEQSGEISAEEAAEWRAESAEFIAFEVYNVYPDIEAIGAGVIGISVEALWAEVDTGKTIAEVATANGVEPQAVIDAAVSAENEYIDAMLAAGLIDDAEATEWKADNVEFITDMVNDTQNVFMNEVFHDDFFEDEMFIEDDYFSTAATVIGIDEETLFVELDSGKSLAEIAIANGVEPQAVIDALVADENAFIDELEQAGEISAEEAAEWRAESGEFIAFEVNHACPNPEAIGAAVIGISVEALWSEVDAGKTIAEVAIANGVEPQAVIDAAVSAENEYVDAMLAAGLIDEAEATEWKAENVEFITDMVNNTQSFEDIYFEGDLFEFDEDDVEIIEADNS